jgi:TPR repeat protein
VTKVFQSYTRVAYAWSIAAMTSLGVCHKKGTGVGIEMAKAAELYARVADAGDM